LDLIKAVISTCTLDEPANRAHILALIEIKALIEKEASF